VHAHRWTDPCQCTLAFLESYISAAAFLHKLQMPSYRSILFSTAPVAGVFGFAWDAVLKHPSASMWCPFTRITGSYTASVGEKQCVIVTDGYVALGIAT